MYFFYAVEPVKLTLCGIHNGKRESGDLVLRISVSIKNVLAPHFSPNCRGIAC